MSSDRSHSSPLQHQTTRDVSTKQCGSSVRKSRGPHFMFSGADFIHMKCTTGVCYECNNESRYRGIKLCWYTQWRWKVCQYPCSSFHRLCHWAWEDKSTCFCFQSDCLSAFSPTVCLLSVRLFVCFQSVCLLSVRLFVCFQSDCLSVFSLFVCIQSNCFCFQSDCLAVFSPTVSVFSPTVSVFSPFVCIQSSCLFSVRLFVCVQSQLFVCFQSDCFFLFSVQLFPSVFSPTVSVFFQSDCRFWTFIMTTNSEWVWELRGFRPN